MSWRRHKVRWGFLPAAIIFTASIWIRMGPVIAILGLVAGILLVGTRNGRPSSDGPTGCERPSPDAQRRRRWYPRPDFDQRRASALTGVYVHSLAAMGDGTARGWASYESGGGASCHVVLNGFTDASTDHPPRV